MRVILIAQTQVTGLVPGYEPHDLPVHAADELAEQAGRLCYLSWNRPNPMTATNQMYLANILDHGHFSVLEHGSATFYVDGVTRNLTHELVRHRHLSYSELSQRYVDSSKTPFITHPGLQQLSDRERADIRDLSFRSQELYSELVDDLTTAGGSRKEARQAARHVLPSGTETRILVTGNHRAWRDMLVKRLSPTADAEFQELARELLRQLVLVAPATYQDLVEQS